MGCSYKSGFGLVGQLVVLLVGACFTQNPKAMTITMKTVSVEATYRRQNSAPHYDVVSRKVKASGFPTVDGMAPDTPEIVEETDVAGVDYDGHRRMVFFNDSGNSYLTLDAVDKRRDERGFFFTGEVEFASGDWETYENGGEVQIVYTTLAIERLSTDLATYMKARLVHHVRSALHVPSHVPIEVSTDRVVVPNDPIRVTQNEIRVRHTSPAEIVVNLRVGPDQGWLDLLWIPLIAVLLIVASRWLAPHDH